MELRLSSPREIAELMLVKSIDLGRKRLRLNAALTSVVLTCCLLGISPSRMDHTATTVIW